MVAAANGRDGVAVQGIDGATRPWPGPVRWLQEAAPGAGPVRQARVLRLRFDVPFQAARPRMVWNARVAQEVRLPTWSFEVKERGAVVFVRAEEETSAGRAVARLFLDDATDEAPAHAHVEIGITGRWQERDEHEPPLGAVGGLVEEAEALMVLLGCHAPAARFAEAYRTRA